MGFKLTPEQEAELVAKGATIGPAANITAASTPKAKGRIRHEQGRMNKTEAAYARYLDEQLTKRLILGYWFEPLKLRLADRTYYNIDFLVMDIDGTLECHEVKGFMEDDAAVKLKVAASQFSIFPFLLIRKTKNGWTTKIVSPN